MRTNKIKKSVIASFLCSGVLLSGGTGFFPAPAASAATLSEYRANLQAEKDAKEQVATELAQDRERKESLQKELARVKEELLALKEEKAKKESGSDTLYQLTMRLNDLEEELRAQSSTQDMLMDELDQLSRPQVPSLDSPYAYKAHGASNTALVNPGPQGTVSYTQDAKNAQHNSTMVFSYAPDQLYKIYCRTGYLTDIELKKGERISFVGGGDTSSWAVNTTTVDGVPHIYVKPVVQSSTTNLIVTTNKRSYQIILNTSNWYNPMVKWTYDLDDVQNAAAQAAKDEETLTADVSSLENLHFHYNISVKGSSSYKPEMVFDDGEKTIIRFRKNANRLPALFLKEKNKKDFSLTNYKTKGDCYIIDRVIDRAELRYSDTDIVRIERKN